MKSRDWYSIVKMYTEKLVGIRSVSPGEGEILVAREVLNLLHADDLGLSYTESGLDALNGDLYGRQNTYAFLRGTSTNTVILLGHFDTVDTQDYGELEPLALNPAALFMHKEALLPSSEQTEDLDDWMFGRGAADMKSGVAINIALMRHLAQASLQTPFPLSVIMIATPDEENESAGVLQAVHFLLNLRERYHLNYLGALNTDYVTSQYPGDTQRYIYAGSIGKLLPSFLCIGREAHAGDPFKGLDANLVAAELIRDISMNDELCDSVPGQMAAPPVTLHSTDLKPHYDVQLPHAAYFYANVLTLTTTPESLLIRLQMRAERSLAQLLQRVDGTEQRWRQARDEQGWQARFQARSGVILSYAQLYAETVQIVGLEQVTAALMVERQRWPAMLDRRELSMHLTQRLWTLSRRQGPAVVIFYAPPYYPALAPAPGPLQDAVDAVVLAHPEIALVQQPYFPYLSDMSYLCLDPDLDVTALAENMPIWQSDKLPTRSGTYALPIEAMQRLGVPAINWGPFGRGAHQRDEAVLMSYSFGVLPQLLLETIEYLAQNVER